MARRPVTPRRLLEPAQHLLEQRAEGELGGLHPAASAGEFSAVEGVGRSPEILQGNQTRGRILDQQQLWPLAAAISHAKGPKSLVNTSPINEECGVPNSMHDFNQYTVTICS